MGAVIYYFSGTGNSLAVARDISKKVDGELISIPSVIDKENIKTDADTIGIVFPVYNHGIPYIIKRFVNKMEDLDKKYIFAICTYGSNPCLSLEYVYNIVESKGGKLAAGFAVKMPYNYIMPSFTIKDFFGSFVLGEVPAEKQQEMFRGWKERLESIYQSIDHRKEGKPEVKAAAIERMVDFLNLRETMQKAAWLKIAGFKGRTDLPFQESIQLMDHGFKCDGKCSGCGICSKLCPVENIKMTDGRPVWQHRCEQCFVCLQWCPEEAIQFRSKTSQGKRYHHPDVKLSDMMLHNRKKK